MHWRFGEGSAARAYGQQKKMVVFICDPFNSNSIIQSDVFCRQDVPTAQSVGKQGQHSQLHCIRCYATELKQKAQIVRWWDMEAGIHWETAGGSRA